jgi:hypothetical protein
MDTYPRCIRKKINMNKSDTWSGTYWAIISDYGVCFGPSKTARGGGLNIVGDLRMWTWLRGWGAADSAAVLQSMCSHGHQRRDSERDGWSDGARRPSCSSGEREE